MDATEIEAMRARIREAPDAVDAVVDEMVRLLGERDEARAEVRRLTARLSNYDMDHALRDAAEQAELLQHGAERARDNARADLARLRAEHAAALDAARREGAEGMQQRCEETCASIASAHAERFVLKTAGGAIYAAREYGAAKCGAECVDAIRALPLDAPGGAPDCTGVTAQWCPRCGDCACPLLHEGNVEGGRTLNDPKCPLHAPSSPHGDAPGGAS